jgi:hypothetical protein
MWVVIIGAIPLLLFVRSRNSPAPALQATNTASQTATIATNGADVPSQPQVATATNAQDVLPNDPVTLVNFGTELLNAGRIADAIELYTLTSGSLTLASVTPIRRSGTMKML